MTIFTKIPVIDLSNISENETYGILKVAQQVKQIYSEIGFAYLINHNVPQKIIDNAFIESHNFHELPLATKLKIKQGKSFRGYIPMKSSTLKSSGLEAAVKPNESESFTILHEVSENDIDYQNATNLAGPNLWPDELPDFKKTILEYNTEMLILANKLVKIFSVAFGMQLHDLDSYFVKPTTCMRLLYYPKQPAIIPENQFGSAPHTDYGFFTILAQDNVTGLQVRNEGNDWIDVPPLPGSFVLNSGDMLKRMTNDCFLSTKHRVINKTGNKRYSIPFFFDSNMYAVISPLSIFCSQKYPAKYAPIKYCEYVMGKVRSNYNIGA